MQFSMDFRFVLKIWVRSYGCIHILNTLLFVFLYCVEIYLELVIILIYYLFVGREVYDKSNRQVVENIFMAWFAGFVHLMKNLVFLC